MKMTTENRGITKLSVAGFKSIAEETMLDIKPLTILAGANSSGKSSFMQPFLLMKQTSHCDYDPGPFLLNGPNVQFTAIEQFFSNIGGHKSDKLVLGVYEEPHNYCVTTFGHDTKNRKIVVEQAEFLARPAFQELTNRVVLSNEMSQDEMTRLGNEYIPSVAGNFKGIESPKVSSNKFSLDLQVPHTLNVLSSHTSSFITNMIHVPGLRGNPERVYQTTGVGSRFPGTFEIYTASIIAKWGDQGAEELQTLCDHLSLLGLTSRIATRRLNDAQIEVMVGRLPKNGRSEADMVSVADVGFGVSQTLPVLVALLVAEPGQLVYLEQPEIHLHPRAQRALAGIIAEAARRGVKVVVETHSSMLLLAIQTLVAQKNISPEIVALHWFQRDKTGMTEVKTAELDDAGRFGDWPVDFADVELEAEGDFIDAVAAARRGQ